MKRLALGLVAVMIFAACGDDDGGDSPANDAGPQDVAADAAPDGTDDATPDGGDDVTDDTADDTAVEPDQVDPEDTSHVDIPGPGADGLLGSPCQADADCVQNPAYICFFGFCTERCRESGQVTQLPGTCENVSTSSFLGEQWGCPSDMSYCMPGLVQDKSTICTSDAKCMGIGADMVCGAAVLISNTIVDGICVPGGDRAATGEPCTGNQSCKSLMCMGEDPESGVEGYCTNHCETNQNCIDGLLCTGIGFQTEEDTNESSAWGGYCLDVGVDTEAGDELTYCSSQDKCPDGYYCNAFIEPSSLVAQTWCIPENEDGTAAVGESCTTASDCIGGSCYWGPEVQEGTDGYCSWDCPGGVDDCGADMACVSRPLHNNGTATDNTDDHKKIGACVYNQAGDACVVGEGWCADGGECLTPESWSESFGQCVIPPTVCEDYCAAVEASCVDENAIAFEVDCATDCASWPEGEEGDTDNDTAHCRLYHATVAAGDPVLHCPHASPDGGGVCVDPEPEPTTCESYCATVEANCTGDNAIEFAVDCATDCASWAEGELGDQGNDTAHCRLYHAGAAADDAALHCPHAAPDGGGVCVDPATPTWDADVKQILDDNCGSCHVSGNSGSWNTGSYASTQADSYYCAGLTKAECFIERITDGSMPTTGSVLTSMTDSGELATLQAWIDGGMPEN